MTNKVSSIKSINEIEALHAEKRDFYKNLRHIETLTTGRDVYQYVAANSTVLSFIGIFERHTFLKINKSSEFHVLKKQSSNDQSKSKLKSTAMEDLRIWKGEIILLRFRLY